MLRVRKLLIITGVILLLSLVAGIFFFVSHRKALPGVISVSDVEPYLKDGDIILRLSNAPWSLAFKDFSLTDKRFSHLGIVRIRDGNIVIINSVGYLTNKEKGVDEVSLKDFLPVARAIGVFRARFADGPMISDKAVEYMGRPFDWSFNLNDDGKIYCTELLYAAIKCIVPEHHLSTYYLEAIGKEIFPLDSISNSSDFDEIMYINLD
jgi:hypothetical protein